MGRVLNLREGEFITGDEENRFWKKLDALGPEEVRRRRAQGIYGEKKQRLVDEWIASQERKLSESVREEDLGIKRYAATTQKIAAIAAIIAATMAIIGVAVSIMA